MSSTRSRANAAYDQQGGFPIREAFARELDLRVSKVSPDGFVKAAKLRALGLRGRSVKNTLLAAKDASTVIEFIHVRP